MSISSSQSNSDQAFWKFSTDEMIKYDLPAAIDYILKVTGKGEQDFLKVK